MLKKLFKKADAKKTLKVEKLSNKEMNKVIGGAETEPVRTTPPPTTSGEPHRPFLS